MAQRVFLHIGTPKSATTSIQDLCAANASALAETGLLWPTGDRYAAVRDFLGTRTIPSDAGAWGQLLDQIRRHEGTALFSNEMLVTLDHAQIGRLLAELAVPDIRVIVTARDLGRVIPSQWQTMIKNGSTVSWRDFAAAICPAEGAPTSESAPGQPDPTELARYRRRFWLKQNVAATVERWAAQLPADRVTVVTVPASRDDRDGVARRFGTVLGTELIGLEQPSATSNASLGAHSAELLRRLNQELSGATRQVRKVGVRDALAKTVLASTATQEPTFALTQAQQDVARMMAVEQVAALEAAAVPVEGDLADLIPEPSPPADASDPGAATDDELLQAATRGLLGLAELFAAGRPPHRS